MPRSTLLLLFVLAASANAQTRSAGPGLDQAAASITEADVWRRIHVIADDSMMGRDTPSPGLEMTARYVADEFRRFGLKPGGEHGTFFQRYEIVRWKLDPAASHLRFMIGSIVDQAEFSRDVRLWTGGPMTGEIVGPVVVLGGDLAGATLPPGSLNGRVALVVLDRSPTGLSNEVNQFLRRKLPDAGPVGIVILSNRDSARFAQEMARQGSPRLSVLPPEGGVVPIVELHERAAGAMLRSAGIDPAAWRAGEFRQRDLPGLRLALTLGTTVEERNSAPNTIGILEGSDPRLREEYLVYSAHMDHIGIRSGGRDSINNGADDDGSGTVGVVEMAEAFSRARPRRSVLFITVSGEEKGLWGSNYFVEHPTVPLERVVADLNMDMIGRNWKDTIVAIGREHSDLGTTLARVNAAHPELNMHAIDDRWPRENFYYRSDHFNFARKGVPILFFFNGTHPDYHGLDDNPDKIDAEKESRILKLLFYLGQEIADRPTRPQWNPESYRRIVE